MIATRRPTRNRVDLCFCSMNRTKMRGKKTASEVKIIGGYRTPGHGPGPGSEDGVAGSGPSTRKMNARREFVQFVTSHHHQCLRCATDVRITKRVRDAVVDKMMMESESSQQFCLRWHNHQSSVLGGLPALLDSGRLTDVTLCAGGRSLRAHRIVLSTCSPYFMDIFKELPSSQQPVIVVLGGGWAELCCLVAFMYAGEVTLPRSLLPGLLKLAAALRITGLTDLNGQYKLKMLDSSDVANSVPDTILVRCHRHGDMGNILTTPMAPQWRHKHKNIPEVPTQTEFEDTFNPKNETNCSPDETTQNRQNDSASSTENLISPFQKSFETHLASKNMEPLHMTHHSYMNETNILHDEPYQGMQILKNLSLKHNVREKAFSVKEELLFDTEKIECGTRNLTILGKKSARSNESKRYLNPVLNEIEPKNRKIDKIVESLKSNQRRSQEMNAPVSRGKSQLSDLQKSYLNLSPNVEQSENKLPASAALPMGSKAADIFANSNIFMEMDSDNTACDAPLENVPTNIKTETDSSPEIIQDMKYVTLSPGIQSIGIHSPTNPKLYATCYVCHKQLSNQYNLRVHLETHQNARHACVACSHVSRSRDALRKHVSYRHPQLNTSHGVGRPCKANQNIHNNLQNTMRTSPSGPNIFNFSNSTTDLGESIDLSANPNTRPASGPDITSVSNINRSLESNNNSQNNGGKTTLTDKLDQKNKPSGSI